MIRSGDHALWDATLKRGRADADRAALAPLLTGLARFGQRMAEAMRVQEVAVATFGANLAQMLGRPVVTTAPTRATATRELEQTARAIRRLRRAGMTERDAAAKLYPRAGSIDVSPRRADGGTLPPRS